MCVFSVVETIVLFIDVCIWIGFKVNESAPLTPFIPLTHIMHAKETRFHSKSSPLSAHIHTMKPKATMDRRKKEKCVLEFVLLYFWAVRKILPSSIRRALSSKSVVYSFHSATCLQLTIIPWRSPPPPPFFQFLPFSLSHTLSRWEFLNHASLLCFGLHWICKYSKE